MVMRRFNRVGNIHFRVRGRDTESFRTLGRVVPTDAVVSGCRDKLLAHVVEDVPAGVADSAIQPDVVPIIPELPEVEIVEAGGRRAQMEDSFTIRDELV